MKDAFIIGYRENGRLKAKQIGEEMGLNVVALFRPYKKDHSTQIEEVDAPGTYLVSIDGNLHWLEAHPDGAFHNHEPKACVDPK